jgi:hypothetical protein
MFKKFVVSLVGTFWAMSMVAAPKSPVDKFIADKEFCAYMASLPENDSQEFLARFQAAMQAAVLFIRHRDPGITETEALFSMKARCDAALIGLVHYG